MEEHNGKGIGFGRIRRVTGYLTGDIKMMNDGKRAEVGDRVKHAGVNYFNDYGSTPQFYEYKPTK